MLARLQVSGMAIIDELSISFEPGFNVITGETGAGKSILIKALQLLTGAKPAKDTVRKGCKHAQVNAEFFLPPKHPALPVLQELGIDVEEGHLLVRRQISSEGRSQGWINDISVTHSTLKVMGDGLLDIFAQHENQRLLKEEQHLTYLDNLLGELPLEVANLSRECNALLTRLFKSVEENRKREQNRDYLEFRLKALTDFDASQKDFEASTELCGHGEKDRAKLEDYVRALKFIESEETSVASSLKSAAKIISNVSPELAHRLEASATEIDDIGYELGKEVSTFDVDEVTLEEAQKRVFGYQNLFRKYGAKDIESLLEEKARLEKEVRLLENTESQIDDTLAELEKLSTTLSKKAVRLTKDRQKAALQVQGAIELELKDLAMPGARFKTEFENVKKTVPELGFFPERFKKVSQILETLSEKGAEKGRFLFSANPGEPLLPLARIASGGEMSRIFLGLKKALAVDADTCVLVFDEIDTGISGSVADVVGRKLKNLSKNFQVLCISHLPQVAAYGDCHFLVKKEKKKDRTESQIVPLDSEARSREIARLLSGAKVDATSLAQAKNLRQKAGTLS